MPLDPTLRTRLEQAVKVDRLLATAQQLIAVPSRTGEAGAVADRLADILKQDGFTVERPAAGHTAAPAVVVRWQTGKPGRTLQFDGHLDTVHLPFVPPAVEGDRLTGSGSSDMKAGVAAMVEGLRALRDADALSAGGILLTAHDLHEAPWAFGEQLNQLIQDGVVGDAVLIPEYMHDRLAVVGRGAATWKATVHRPGAPIHEVMRPKDEPDVLALTGDLLVRLKKLQERLAKRSDPVAGCESVFVGQVHGGMIFNQYPQEATLDGTLRWLPTTKEVKIRAELEKVLHRKIDATPGAALELKYQTIRQAFALDEKDPIVAAFQQAHQAVSGKKLKRGVKPFCDDGNSFCGLAQRAAITHGPQAGGAHTLNEWVSISDLGRVALVYALTAVAYCPKVR